MTARPIFISTNDINNPVKIENVEFNWVKGLSYSQKCKRREEFHKEISKIYRKNKILEISTKSDYDIGINLSAFNLKFRYNDIVKSVEDIYQNSKIIENNKILGFKYEDIAFENEPRGMFYDWLYISALLQHPQYFVELNKYDVFTDIEFNPKKSYNCQARAVAIFISLYRNNKHYFKNIEEFKEYYKSICSKNQIEKEKQMSLFN